MCGFSTFVIVIEQSQVCASGGAVGLTISVPILYVSDLCVGLKYAGKKAVSPKLVPVQ